MQKKAKNKKAEIRPIHQLPTTTFRMRFIGILGLEWCIRRDHRRG
ncbi:MAG: hypothetical protein ACM3NO_01650 [Deltaproteobacteria bacterium]